MRQLLRTPVGRSVVVIGAAIIASVLADFALPRESSARAVIPPVAAAMVPIALGLLSRRADPGSIPQLRPPPSTGVAVLLSNHCTTGWFDWTPGELWLTPDALVRVRRGVRSAFRPVSPLGARVNAMELRFSPTDSGRTYIPLVDIRTARLRRGVLNGRLAVATYSGQRYKLLWLRSDPAYDVLRERLGARGVVGRS